MMKILVTGGLGFIGSHVAVLLSELGNEVILIDNFNNSKLITLENINKITNKDNKFIECDLSKEEQLYSLYNLNNIDSIIHLAGYKSVSESVSHPLLYYQNNFLGTLNLIQFMHKKNINKIVFSSSATVYGNKVNSPLKEVYTPRPINPYGEIKFAIEKLLKSFSISNKKFSAVSLRYFNPIGSHDSGLIGDNPINKPNNIMPVIMEVASMEKEVLKIYGNDYNTKDGTGVRDYIHVMDVAEGHLSALKYISKKAGHHVFNLGTGYGVSVLELLNEVEDICKIKIPYVFSSRRKGDISTSYADASKAYKKLGWKAKYNLNQMCLSAWKHKLHLMR